jgi:hypothetical protein
MARVSIKSAASSVPKQGQRSLPISYNFANQASFNDDLSPEMQAGEIDAIQRVYVDNSQNANPLTIVFNGLQPLVINPGKQGVYPVYAQGLLTYKISTPQAAVIVNLIFLNTMEHLQEWGGA